MYIMDIMYHNKDKPWFDDQDMRTFDFKKEGNLRWTSDRFLINYEEFLRCHVSANKTYLEAKRQFCVRNRHVLMNALISRMCTTLISGGPLMLYSTEFVIASVCWLGWWTGVRFGCYGWSAVGSFWQQAVQGIC